MILSESTDRGPEPRDFLLQLTGLTDVHRKGTRPERMSNRRSPPVYDVTFETEIRSGPSVCHREDGVRQPMFIQCSVDLSSLSQCEMENYPLTVLHLVHPTLYDNTYRNLLD